MFFTVEYRHPPDGLSAFAGCFRFLRLIFCGLRKANKWCRRDALQIYLQSISVMQRCARAAARLLLKNETTKKRTIGERTAGSDPIPSHAAESKEPAKK